MKLANRSVLITGASKGIGRALALGFAREGANVAVNYNTDRKGALEVVAEIEALGRRAVAVQANIARVSAIERMFKNLDAKFGALDGLVNNAAITGWTALLDATEAQWDEVLNTNLKGTFFCSLEAARRMKKGGGGTIINVSTNIAALGVKNLSIYAASKGGIHALTRHLAVELAPCKIRVNTFAPGPTLVERNLKDDPDYDATWGGVVPLGRTATAEEMVGAAVFLASEDSSYMTGQVFYVDGGWTVAGRIPGGNLDRALRRHRPPRKPKR